MPASKSQEWPNPDWGETPNFIALATPERLADVPEHIRTGPTSLKGLSGICVGREDELRRLRRFFDTTLQQRREGTGEKGRRFATLITNAPGAGKSTLLEEFARRQIEEGVPCIAVGPEKFQDDAALISTIMHVVSEAPTAKRRKRNRRAADILTQPSVARAVGAAAARLFENADGTAITAALRGLQKGWTALSRNWAKKPPVTPEDAFRELSGTTEKGFIVTVDECTAWDGSSTDRAAVMQNLRLIADPALSRTSGINGGLLMAGLGSAPRVVDDLKLSRALTLWPGELSEQDAMAAIGATVVLADIHEDRVTNLLIRWVHELAATFHSWPEHTANAADMAVWVAEVTEADADPMMSGTEERQRLEWVKTLTAQSILGLYGRRCTAAKRAAGPDTDARMVALANLTANRIPLRSAEEMIARCLADRPATESDPEPSAVGIRGVMEAGFWRLRDNLADTEPDPDHVDIPVPNLRRFVTDKTHPVAMQRAYELAADILRNNNPEALPDDVPSGAGGTRKASGRSEHSKKQTGRGVRRGSRASTVKRKAVAKPKRPKK